MVFETEEEFLKFVQDNPNFVEDRGDYQPLNGIEIKFESLEENIIFTIGEGVKQ